MTTYGPDDDLEGATFRGAGLAGARFVECDLTGVVMRGVEVAQMDIDAPWLVHGGHFLVNGVDVIAYVEGELDRRFPGRELRRAEDPEGLREAWAALERSWAATLDRAAALPPGSVDVQVDGEWSFAQTLRHLVHATDIWFGKGIQGSEDFHPLGLGDTSVGGGSEGIAPAAYDDVLEARAGRATMVRGFIAATTPGQLDEERRNPHDPDYAESVRQCLHVILEEEWEHQRFALRDLEALSRQDA
jgi:hypothetical protein